MTTSADIVNESLELIASQAQITALNDGSVEGNAAAVVYAPTVQLLLRQLDPDFARLPSFELSVTAAASVPSPWAYEYAYPADCLRLRQLAPPASGPGSLADPFDPVPIRGEVAFDPNGQGANKPAKVILSNQQSALATYTTSLVTEDDWDPAFREAVVRRLANPLAMAIAGRPDFARELLEESERYAGLAELADDSADGQV